MNLLEKLRLRGKSKASYPSLGGKVIRVGPGDTLRSIARREYGDENAWDLILNANSARIKDAESLNVGSEIRLP